MGIGNAPRTRDNSLAQSFMGLGFVASVLLIVVQLNRPPATDIVAPPAAPLAPVATLPESDWSAGSPSTSADSAAHPTVKAGLARLLEPVIHPLVAIDPVKLVVDLSDRQVSLFQADQWIASYGVAIGQAEWETPTGEFSVTTLQVDPVWQHPFTKELIPPGANNPLGSRWIGFWSNESYQIGFHGTREENLIGQAVSHGCLRMREADIQALYGHVTVGTPVIVQP